MTTTDKPVALGPDLISAYVETKYKVSANPAFELIIDVANQSLIDLYNNQGVSCAAFVTACNPFSAKLGEDENIKRQKSLEMEIRQRGLTLIPGIGQHPSGKWPGEPSFLILGISLEAAKSLGRSYKQNAIVWISDNAVPQLVLLR